MPSGAPDWVVAYPVGQVVGHTITMDDGTEKVVPAIHETYRLGSMHRSQCGRKADVKLMSINSCKSTFEGSISISGDTTTIKSKEKTICARSGSGSRSWATWSEDPMEDNGTFHCLNVRY
tara:strand:- start:406 stop:765 length:360 start_codon:yes stop_codon:yes gene_type:complete